MFFPTVDEATKIWIKGRDFSISRLLGDTFKDKWADYEGGSLAIFRLAPQDCKLFLTRNRISLLIIGTADHRYHSPVDGICGPQKLIAGKYYTVRISFARCVGRYF